MRSHLLTLSVTCALASFASAQNYVTSPSGYLSTEGATYANALPINDYLSGRRFGANPDYIIQRVDNTHVGAGVRTIDQIDYRMNTNRGNLTSEGRSWKNVAVYMGTGDYNSTGTTYSANYSNTPTMVFSSSVSWPTVVGNIYAPNVADWGKEVSFAFGRPFVQINQEATISEYQFTGGVLANAQPWTAEEFYYLDSAYINVAQPGYQYIANTGGTCTDSSKTTQCQAYIYLRTYSQDSLQNADTFELDRGIFNGADNALYFRAHSLAGPANPVIQLPGWCDGLGVDLNQAFLIDSVTTSATGGQRKIETIKYVPVGPGIQIYMQVAWADSSTGAFSLSRTSMNQLAPQPPGGIKVVRGATGTATGTLQQNLEYTPLSRISYK